MATVSYPRAFAVSAMQAVVTSGWIAAGGLSPTRRRLVRLGTVAAAVAGTAALPDTRRSIRELRTEIAETRDEPEEAELPTELPALDKRRAAAVVGVLGLTVAITLGRRRLEKRWLARLARAGHPNPHLAVALRMAPVAFAAELSVQLADMHGIRREQ